MKLFSVTDAAKELHISTCTLRRMIRAEEISFRKIGKLFFFTEGDLAQFLENCVVPMKSVTEEGCYVPNK